MLPLLVGIQVRDARADIYTWVDRDGQLHFTDNQALIPSEYRARAHSRPSSPPPEDAPSSTPPAPAKKDKRAKYAPSGRLSPGRQAKVIAVLDGDTIVISGGEKVRYAGLNTPETHHPDKLPEYCGREAFEANRRLVAGKTVRLEYDERQRDKYGRLLAYVHVDSLFVNAELIRQGFAQVSTYKDTRRYHKEFERLQQSAIAARRGLWGGCSDLRPRHDRSGPAPQAAGR